MAYTMWRGVVGLIKPTRRPGSLEELIRLLPPGIGIVPLLLNEHIGRHHSTARHVVGEIFRRVYITQRVDKAADRVGRRVVKNRYHPSSGNLRPAAEAHCTSADAGIVGA
jgi:hypothetical protein